MRIYFFIIIIIIYIFFQNFLFSNSNEIQNSNIPNKPNIFDKINDKDDIKDMILNISLYLENGGNINITDSEGNTLLMKSVSLGYYDLAD